MKHLHLVIPESLYDLLKKEAFEKKVSLARVVRQYLPGDVMVVRDAKVEETDFKPGAKIVIGNSHDPKNPWPIGVKKGSEVFPKGILAEGRGTQGYCKHGYNPRTCKFEECRKKVTW